MNRPSGDVRIRLYRHPVDMSRTINGLVAMVEGELELDPFGADLFILCNRSRNLVKMIAWEGNGFELWMKRLDKSRVKWPLSILLIGVILVSIGCNGQQQYEVDIQNFVVDHKSNFTELIDLFEASAYDRISSGGLMDALEVIGADGKKQFVRSAEGQRLGALLESTRSSGCDKVQTTVVCQMPTLEVGDVVRLSKVIRARSTPTNFGDACTDKELKSDGVCATDLGGGWWIQYEIYTDPPVEGGSSILK